MDNQPEKTTAEGLLAGDSDTISYVYQTLGPKIIGFVMNNSGTKEEGKELFQNAYVKAFQNLKDGKYREEGKFEPWFNQIARNIWLEALRQRRRSATQSIDDVPQISDVHAEDLAESLLKNQHLEALNQALTRLAEPCRSMLYRFHGEESVSSLELAEEMGKNDGAIRAQLRRCRQELRKLVVGEIDKYNE
jgi:RNA polymerase sigma factor (sigma-70 family)